MAMKRQIHIQIHTDRILAKTLEPLLRDLQRQIPDIRFYHQPTYINLDTPPLDNKQVSVVWWEVLEPLVTPGASPSLRSSSIITIQGQDGWNDYQLLHHYCPKDDKIDQLPRDN